MASSTDKHSDADFHSLVEDVADSRSQRADGYVDFDQYIDIQLRKTSSTIKSTDVLTAVVGAGTLLTAYLLIFIVFDQWLIPGGFGPTARVLLLSSLLVAVAGWIGWKVIWPWRRRVNGLYSASTIEKASPSFKGSLVSLVDLLRTEREITPEVFRSIERRAAVALTHVDVRETVDRRSLLRLSVALFAVVVAFCGYWILSPKNPASSLWRAVAPASETAVATRTKIDSVRPGDVDVVARSQVDVTAEVRGQMPPQATLYYTTADHKFVDERIDARPSAEGSREFHFIINGDNGAGILQDLKYRIEAGDDKTGDYKIHVIQPPAATIDSIHLDYPEYTRLGSSDQTTGAIDAIEGTHVKLRATANMPLRSASLQFFDEESASKRAEEVPMHVDGGKKLHGEWDLRMRQDGTYPHFYRIFCTGAEGETERSPNLYSLAIRPDQPPVIVLRDPKTDLDLPANAVLPLFIEAHDPDFALTSVNLKIEKDGAPLIGPPELYDGHGRHEQHYKGTYRWSLSDYHFRPKDTITYWLEAQDNRKPLANTANSARLRIRITDPVPQSEVNKSLEMAENRQQQESKKSDEEQNAAQKPEDDQVTDATKPEPRQPKQPKEQKANAQEKDQSPEDMKQAEQDDEKKAKDQKGEKGQGGGDSGNSDSGNSDSGNSEKGNSKNGKGQTQGDKTDKSSGEGGEKGQSEKLSPDRAENDPKTLQKIYDHMQQQDADKQGNKSDSKDGNKDSKKEGSEKKPDAAKPDQKPGNESGDQGQQDSKGNAGKRENQGGPQNKDSQPGAEPNPKSDSKDPNSKNDKNNNGNKPDEKNEDRKNGDGSKSPNEAGNNSEQNQPQPKNSAGGSDNNSKEQKSNGNPQGDNKPGEPSGDKQDKQRGAKPTGEKQPDEKQTGGKQPGETQKPDRQSDSAQKGEKGQNGAAGDKPQNDAGSKQEKGQPSPGDQSGADKSGGKSSDSPQQSEQGQSSKPDASNPSKPDGANSPDQQDKPNQGGSPQDASQQKGGSQDKAQKDAKSQAQSSDNKPNPSGQKVDKKNPTKSTDKTERQGDRSTQSQQQDASAKPHSGTPQNDTHQFKPNNAPDGQKPDEKAPKGRRKNTEHPEEVPKAIEDKTNEKPQPKGMRNEKQTNPNGDEQSDVGKTGDTQRTQDKTSPLEQEGTDSPGAKRQVREKNPDAKTGRDQSPQEQGASDQQQQSRKEGQPGSPKDQSKTGEQSQQPQQQGQEGQPQQGQKGQPGKEGQQAQEGENGQPTKGGQPGQKSGKPGEGAQSPDGKPTDGKQASQSPGGKSPAAGMGSGKGNSNGGGHNNGTGTGDGEGLVDTSKQANLDYARKATDLMLNRLENQLSRGKVDEKLLKELGWTKDEVRRFVERMRRQAQADQGGNTPADEARRLQFEETLRSLDLKQSAKNRSGVGVQKVGGVEIDSRRSIPPAEYRELYDAFNRSISRSQTPRDKK